MPMKNALSRNFNYDLDQRSPVVADYERSEKVADDGSIFVVYEKVDYSSIQASHGDARDWSLDSLFKAGINPQSFAIHTGFNTRLEGVNILNEFASQIDAVLALVPKVEPSNEE